MEADTIGMLALCASMVGVLIWIIKYQAKMLNNDLKHIKSTMDSLPCQTGAGCPEDDE